MKYGILTAFIVFILDQITKYYIAFHLFREYGYMKITSFLNIVFVKNTGISFSMFSGATGIEKWVLILVILIIIIGLIYWLYKEEDFLTKIGLGMIIGGAIGNLIDRLTYGGVVDFIDFYVKNYHWPAFNIADSFIFIGTFIILIQGFKLTKKEKNNAE